MLKIVSIRHSLSSNHFDFHLELLGVAGHDITAPHKDDAIKHLSFKIKSAPDANTVSRLLFDIFLF